MALKQLIVNENSFDISYEICNQKAKKDFIVLHGWGANKELMKQAFAKFLPEFRHIYIDLPGFGNSSNTVVMNTQGYAEVIEAFITALGLQKHIIAGHSFGGKVATLLAPQTLVLLSSAGILEKKPFGVKAKIALFKLLKPFGAVKLRKFFVASDGANLSPVMYEVFKIVVNEDYEPIFKQCPSKALVFWGKEDQATTLSSGEKIASLLKEANLFIYEGDHYFFLKHAKTICETIQKESRCNI